MPFNGPQPCQSDSVQASQWCNKSLGLASGNQGYPLNPGLTRYGDINESLCFVHHSKLDTPVCSVNVHTAVFPDLHRLNLALGISHKAEVSFQLATQSECGPDDRMARKAISGNENNLFNETAVLSYR